MQWFLECSLFGLDSQNFMPIFAAACSAPAPTARDDDVDDDDDESDESMVCSQPSIHPKASLRK